MEGLRNEGSENTARMRSDWSGVRQRRMEKVCDGSVGPRRPVKSNIMMMMMMMMKSHNDKRDAYERIPFVGPTTRSVRGIYNCHTQPSG